MDVDAVCHSTGACVEACKHVCLTAHVPARLGGSDVQANAPIVTPTAAPSSADSPGYRHHRCYAGSGDRYAWDRSSGEDTLPHVKMVSIGALSHHRDVHDWYNTRVLPQVPHSKSMIHYGTILDALHIGAHVDSLDGNKRHLRWLKGECDGVREYWQIPTNLPLRAKDR